MVSQEQKNQRREDEFERIIVKMPRLLNKLRSSPALRRDSLYGVAQRGIYVFYDNDIPIYVGRSNRLRQRLLEHSRPSSRHNSATFAFLLATEEAQGLGFSSMQRNVLQNEPAFKDIFQEAKERVGRMNVRVVEISDPIEQTVFELYAALKLGTPYNDFENH